MLLASTGGARSPCVEQEVGRWLATKGPDSILIPLVEGMLSWSSAEGGFDPTASTAIVPALVTPRDRVNDMAWASDGTHLAATGGLDPETVEVLEASTERDVCSRLLAMLGAGWLADTIGRPRSACATNGVPNLAPVPTTLMPFHGRPLGSR